ncbi:MULTISPECIES: aminoglycoside phosphotransferase family protein [unclassified Streptomyces]|uniref:aminoglycoside phosphotransferase family protein n=1 Tax=unclassified Streptomyces TaxID=2593676 RepID=UPI002DD80C05|nr:aminoglycoside phosphotransferase family protein [Streptomyces sp. NBC_01750]WSB03205.1 aminoglycoside phosphotransferase family protein [Streptomyces sp. NBC_01794]WSD32527.1 aminoglycoside phosphotransferase family protein [Streptomyces sp. NBC_01750]
MDEKLTTELLTHLCAVKGLPLPERAEVRVWSMSGVERVTFPDRTTAIFKYAKQPFDNEAQALRLAHTLGVPVPELRATAILDSCLGMLLEDLGAPTREADDLDGVAAAVVLHDTRTAPALSLLDEGRLSGLPVRAAQHLDQLRATDRWPDTADIADMLDQIAKAAGSRATGTTLAPFGWVHSEFHPTSLHIGDHGWRLLDFARAFTGPGLLDLASYHGTTDAPSPIRLRVFLEQYVTAGGHEDALAARGGLAAEAWALGWHRMWAVEWFMDQAIRWINDPAKDPAYIPVVRRHLNDVVQLLEV